MPNGTNPPIDYTNLGYESLRAAMLALVQESLPEWTDFSENDLGVLLVELFAYACDITLYYQTRIANNLLPATSDEPAALVQLLRFIGYELRPPAPANAELRIGFNASEIATVSSSFTIPAGTQFTVSLSSGQQLTFETVRDQTISPSQLTPQDAAGFKYFFPLAVVQGSTVSNEAVAISDGTPNQAYPLKQIPVIAGSIVVTVNEASGVAIWQEVPTLASSSPVDRSFVVQRDATGTATLVFGDNINGMIPPSGTNTNPATIQATYRVGGGPEGNVPANTSFVPVSTSLKPAIINATNVAAASGGTSGEDVNQARLVAPHLYRTQERAVTLQDYTDLALQVPGVGKALAIPAGWNQVVLYIAPSGQITNPSELLQRDVLSFFETRRMATTALVFHSLAIVDIYLAATIYAQPYFLVSDVQAAVEQAIADYLAFDAVNFGQQIYLSKVYDVIQNLPQVISLTVYKFNTNPRLTDPKKTDPSTKLPLPYSPTNPDIVPGGIIFLKPNELPRPGYRDNPPTLKQTGGVTVPIPVPIVLDIHQGGAMR